MLEFNFDDIRPYYDFEVKEAVNRILQSNKIPSLLSSFFSKQEIIQIVEKLHTIETVYDFQIGVIVDILNKLNLSLVSEITCDNISQLDRNKGYLFISNHRDIVLDPSFLALTLKDHGFQTQEVAIGNNLLIEPWIADIFKLNKSFIVRRDLQGRELLHSSKMVSSYIRSVIERNSNVWIAQREGRAKDGNDLTQASVLKMLNLGACNKNIRESFASLNIVPLAISYEYDACDVLKAKELFRNSNNCKSTKSTYDDLLSMKYGLIGKKGKINYSFAKPLTLETLPNASDLNEFYDILAEKIDTEIHSNFKLYSSHYISYDLLNETTRFSDKYSEVEKHEFLNIIDKKIKQLVPEFTENIEFKKLIYSQYSNILKNHLSLK